MRDGTPELYDYDHLRHLSEATMFDVRVPTPTLVLGGSQDASVLDATRTASVPIRRRRGGGGVVLLRPDDLWIDWWLPQSDPRWSNDVRVSSMLAGSWWAAALGSLTDLPLEVYDGPLTGLVEHRVVCFAGRGAGEVFIDGRKTVGVTQWRVREGVFVSTVLHAGPTTDVVAYLTSPPSGLIEELDHHTLNSLKIPPRDDVLDLLVRASGSWHRESQQLSY